MKIYTSYYARMKSCYQNYAVVCISNSSPEWFPVILSTFRQLYPEWSKAKSYKEGKITWEQFADAYRQKLSKLNREKVLSAIMKYGALYGKDVVLTCWEGPGKHCHRHLLAEWLGCVEELPAVA